MELWLAYEPDSSVDNLRTRLLLRSIAKFPTLRRDLPYPSGISFRCPFTVDRDRSLTGEEGIFAPKVRGLETSQSSYLISDRPKRSQRTPHVHGGTQWSVVPLLYRLPC